MQRAILVLLGLASAYGGLSVQPARKTEIKKNRFGAIEVIDWLEDGMKKIVEYPWDKYVRDYSAQAQYIKEATQVMEYNRQREKDNLLYTCQARGVDGKKTDPGFFLPIYLGAMNKQGQVIQKVDGICFKDITLTYNFQAAANGDIEDATVTIDAQNARSLFCYEWFFFGNSELMHVDTIFTHGKHTITFKNLSPDAKIDLARNGIYTYLFCDGWVDTFVSVFKSLLAFVGGLGPNPKLPIIGSHVPEYMINENKIFLRENIKWNLEERKVQKIDIDENLIQSGDFIAIFRLDGLDPIIMIGTGSHSGHSVMALRFDGELYIVESQDGWYWPNHGIQRTPFKQWIQWAQNADFHVAHLPLTKENREKFNETAAIEFWNKTAGLPYGYHNFLYGWIDTPDQNWPPILPWKLVPVAFSFLEKIIPSTVNVFFAQALNKRLGTEGLSVADLTAAAAKKNMSIEDLMAVVEKDFIVYHGEKPRDGWSYVCSSYVIGMYKAAGLFGNMSIQATEFGPKDVYQLKFFQTGEDRPQICKDNDPELPYCQLLGRFKFTMPGFNTIAAYSHMNEKCPSVAPDFVRPDGC